AKGATSFDALWAKQPPLGLWLMGQSVALLGPSELSARLPQALLALIGALVTYAIGARIGRRRGGALAALVLVSSPLFLFEARLLGSDMATVTTPAIPMLGLVGLAWPEPDKPAWRRPVDILLAVGGLILGTLAAGLFLGAFVPLAAAAVAALAFGPS